MLSVGKDGIDKQATTAERNTQRDPLRSLQDAANLHLAIPF